MSVQDEFARAEPYLRARAYATIEADPEFLFDHEGGPYGVKADIILARLIGHDDQVVRDDLRLDRIESVWLEPIHERLTLATPEVSLYPTMRTAEYGLRSGFAVLQLDIGAIWPPAGVETKTGRYTVLFLRYKRRFG